MKRSRRNHSPTFKAKVAYFSDRGRSFQRERRRRFSVIVVDQRGARATGCAKRSFLAFGVAHRLVALEGDAVGDVHDTIEDGVGEGRVVEPGMPGVDRQL